MNPILTASSTLTINADKLMDGLWIVLKVVALFLVCRIVARIIKNIVERALEKTPLETGMKRFVNHALYIALWILTVLIVAGSAGVDLTALTAIVSVITLALSLSMQNIFSNIFSGITILFTKPFVVGDFVEIAGVSGTVKEINLMRTNLDTVDNQLIQIPNADIAAAKITNYSAEPLRRVDLYFTASYDAPTALVKKALMEAIEADSRIKGDPAPFVALNKYNDSNIEYVTRSWVDNTDYWAVYFDLNEAVRESFAKHGVEFTYPHTVVHMAEK